MPAPLRLGLLEPDIPQNTAAMLRTAACLGVPVDVIGPAGFVFGERRMRRAGLDYLDRVRVTHHQSWEAFVDLYRRSAAAEGDAAVSRLVLLTTRGDASHIGFRYRPGDVLLVGRESAGVPADVHRTVDARVRIPIADGMRSLNVAVAAAMVLGEALRQLGRFPEPGS